MKKMLIWSLVFFFGLAPIAFAQGFVPLAPIPGLTEGATTDPAGLATFFNNLYKYLIGLAAVLAVIQITWAGLNIALHQDNVSSITDSKGKIYNAIFGLILVLSPVLVFSIINPSILNLSINLPELKTTTGTSAGTGGITSGVQPPAQNAAIVAATSAGCVIVTSNPQVLSCPDQASAQTFVDNCIQNGGTGNVSSLIISSKYQATCSTPATVACTPTHSGPYLETAVCASLFPDATNYKCTNGLTLQVPPCKTPDAASGKCLDTSVTVYCAGKNTTLVFYAYTTLGGLKLNSDTTSPVPRDAGAVNTFTSSCANDGGVVAQTLTSGAKFAIGSISGLLLAPFYTGCSSDYGTIPVNSGRYSGAQCFSVVMSCNPPK